MDLTDLKQEIEQLEDNGIKGIFNKILSKLIDKDEIILQLQNRVTELESRVLETEKYSSKDCLIIENMPEVDGNLPLATKVCAFFDLYLSWKTDESSFKACHYLSSPKFGRTPPAIIVKFVYFGEKQEIFGRKSWLAQKKNPRNNLPIFIKERLPKLQNELKMYAEQEGLITTTHNCNIKVFQTNAEGQFRSVIVNSKKAIDDIKEKAVKRKPKVMQSSLQTPRVKGNVNEAMLRSALKRIRESPADESMTVLKNICLDPQQLQSESNANNPATPMDHRYTFCGQNYNLQKIPNVKFFSETAQLNYHKV